MSTFIIRFAGNPGTAVVQEERPRIVPTQFGVVLHASIAANEFFVSNIQLVRMFLGSNGQGLDTKKRIVVRSNNVTTVTEELD